MGLEKEIEDLKLSIKKNRNLLENWYKEKKIIQEKLNLMESELYKKSIYLAHINEIFRLARIQFSRLRGISEATLTESDIKELNKWISRAKTEDGLKDIRDAIAELSKYSPSEIRSNLYALVQKIIIEGPYRKKAY